MSAVACREFTITGNNDNEATFGGDTASTFTGNNDTLNLNRTC